ncbi:hypothetical protein ACVWWO_000032 [Bradyrhizobium sp. F1.13.1]
MRSVPASEWDLSGLEDTDRRIRLLQEVSGDSLIGGIVIAAEKATSEGQASFQWQQAIDKEAPPDTFRIVSQIPLPERLFDQLFNGRCGYRAQYFLRRKARPLIDVSSSPWKLSWHIPPQ